MVTTEVKHWVEFTFPGALYNNISHQEIPSIDTVIIPPQGTFAYRLYTTTKKTAVIDGETFVNSTSENIPGTVFINAEKFTLDTLPNTSEFQSLRENMEGNGYPVVVKCNRGNWQLFDTSVDKIVMTEESQS